MTSNNANKTKSIYKNNNSLKQSSKPKPFGNKNSLVIAQLKNFDMETATELPSIDEERLTQITPIASQKIIALEQELPPVVIHYENGLIEVDIFATHKCKTLW